MLDQIFEVSRKAAESSLQMQQAMFKHWTQDAVSPFPMTEGLATDWGGATRKRFIELTVELLEKHREALDSSYRLGIQTIERLLRLSEAKSSEDSYRAVEEVWRSLFDSLRGQFETRSHEFQTWAERLFALARKSQSASTSA